MSETAGLTGTLGTPGTPGTPRRADTPEARPFDLIVWRAPHDIDPSKATALVESWLAKGGDPASSPFEPNTDIGWFYRELKESAPELDAVSDAAPRKTKVPIWASGSDEAPARVVGIRLTRPVVPAELELILSLTLKYDQVVFDTERKTVKRPLEQMDAYASATFWPRGAIRAVTAGALGAIIAIAGWVLNIPVASGIAVIVGGLFFLLAAWTLAHETRRRFARH